VQFTDNGDAALTCFFLFFWMTVMTLIYTDSNNTHARVMLVSFLMIRVLYACVVSDGKKAKKKTKSSVVGAPNIAVKQRLRSRRKTFFNQ
jgi:hypothetical protein